jgi:hypothetical protein
MAQDFIPLLAPMPELLPTSGEVVITQSKGLASGSSMVTLSEEVMIGTPVDSFAGLGFESIGGLLTGAVCVVNVYVFRVQLIPSVTLTNQV